MTQLPVTVTFDYQEPDNDVYQEWFLRNSPVARKKIRNWQLGGLAIAIVSLVMGVYVFVTKSVEDGSTPTTFATFFIAYGIAFGIYAIAWMPHRMRTKSLRHVKKLRAKLDMNGRYGKRSITIENSTFRCIFPAGTSELDIRSMKGVATTDTHSFFFADGAVAFVVPRKSVESGDLDALIERYRQVRTGAPATIADSTTR